MPATDSAESPLPPRQGAYGFQVAGLERGTPLLGRAEPDWPRLHVVRASAEADPGPGNVPWKVVFDDRRAELWLGGRDRVIVDRSTMTVRVITEQPVGDQELAHPYLGLAALWASRWLGRQILHGGAFLYNGRAWAVLGDKEGGKSSTLAWLLQRGHEIISDDLLVLEGGTVFSGPRCVDLRHSAAAVMGGEQLGTVGARERWRLHPGQVPPSMPLSGVVFLGWGERVVVEPVSAEERLRGLVQNSGISPSSADSAAYLDLAALPSWRFVRPPSWDQFDRANGELLESLG